MLDNSSQLVSSYQSVGFARNAMPEAYLGLTTVMPVPAPRLLHYVCYDLHVAEWTYPVWN